MTEITSTRYIVREIDGKFAVETVQKTKHHAAFWTRADAEAYAAMRNEMRAKEAPPVEAVPGPYVRVGSEIRGPVPMPIDHDHCKGFDEHDGYGYLIAESCLHEPTGNVLAASWEMLAALKGAYDAISNKPGRLPNAVKAMEAAIAKAEGRS